MLQIDPQTKLPIVRQLQDPADVTGYYVRATVYNSLLKTVIQTIDLTDDGAGRFSGTFNVPSTEGLFFDITTRVYTDAGYTTPSTTYGSESQSFLGALRWSLQYWNNGGGADVNYKKIEDLFVKVLGKQEFLSKDEVAQIVSDAKNVLNSSIGNVNMAVRSIEIPKVEIPEQKETDFTPVLNAIANIVPTISEINSKSDVILNTQDEVKTGIDIVAQQIEIAKSEVVAKQEELNTAERQNEKAELQSECDIYREQLAKIQSTVQGINTNFPTIQPKKEPAIDEMALRVKKFTKI